MNYLIVVAVGFRRESDGVVACESAFAGHLRMLLGRLAPEFDRLTVVSPRMNDADYERGREHFARIDEARERIRWVPLHTMGGSRARYLARELWGCARRVAREVRGAGLVHSGISEDPFRPMEFLAVVLAAWHRVPSIFVMDIDFRESARMSYETGRWGPRAYWLSRLVYDRLGVWQIRAAVRLADLLLLKGRALVRDFGRGRPHVRDFLDPAFSAEHLIGTEALDRKLERLREPGKPLETVYFGRLIAYKGVDRCIRAVVQARDRYGADVRLSILGVGEEREALETLARELDAGDAVSFEGGVPFGAPLFERVRACDLLLAAPLSEDTPRSALDAMASGVPVLAFDTYYYRDLAEEGGACVVPWPSVDALAERLAALARDREPIARMARAGRAFAERNTQEIWLDRRLAWTRELLRP